ncbi:MAG: YgiQ family radical SAM protein [Bacteroidales bacterium]
MNYPWIPTTVKELKQRGGQLPVDVILFSGDAYVDHPSFGSAVIARLLESMGISVVIVPQPNWQDDLRDFKKFGIPNMFFAVTAGNMDSMVNHYTANKRLRSDDAYTPGARSGARPDYAASVYSNILKTLYPDVPVIAGGVEASLRRLTHFDYWSDKLMPSILITSKADLLMYGMAEQPLRELVEQMKKGRAVSDIKNIRQTAYIESASKLQESEWKDKQLYSFAEALAEPKKHAENFKIIETESNRYLGNVRLLQDNEGQMVVINPMNAPMPSANIDAVYKLPFTRLPHPKYRNKGDIPAYNMIRHSVNMHRGCFGGCSFCTISAHQGKFISSRSEESIINEVKTIAGMEDFKGMISDLGGPSANMYRMQGFDLEICKKCKRPSCISPEICFNLNTDHSPMLEIYRKAAKVKGVKKAVVSSGIRYDMIYMHKDEKTQQQGVKYLEEVIEKHVSGRFKVAPEHTSDKVLKMMRKSDFRHFVRLYRLFEKVNRTKGLRQQLIPYFISSHPMCENEDMVNLAERTKELGYRLEQIQDFTPTPMTLSTVIYYSGYDPYSKSEVYVAKEKTAKLEQRSFFFWYKPENQNRIKSLMTRMGKGQNEISSLLGKTIAQQSFKKEKRRPKQLKNNSKRRRT